MASPGINGIGVLMVSAGMFTMYCGINDVPMTDGLRFALRGQDPKLGKRGSIDVISGSATPASGNPADTPMASVKKGTAVYAGGSVVPAGKEKCGGRVPGLHTQSYICNGGSWVRVK